MKVLCLGSLNIDKVYSVEHIVRPKETIESKTYRIFCGGKGLNQSVALAKAGADVAHAGMVGSDGTILTDALKECGVNTGLIRLSDSPSGHAVIQIDPQAQNCIIIFGGANRCITKEYIDQVLSEYEKGDILLLQNEISNNAYAIEQAHQKGMTVVLNPSPFDAGLEDCDFNLVDLFMVNEVEGQLMAKCESSDPEAIRAALKEKYPDAAFVLTLGEAGVCYFSRTEEAFHPIFRVKAVDTTAAGDTFTGYFLSSLAEGLSVKECLRRSSAASAICVSRNGASPSIPSREEVEEFLSQN